ncbi:hypothetical protein EMO89_01560 [Bifidobacterium tissieri]|uniref:Uncharacterized protein n=1 Tax=Bifidobacterium tissieri TaxID=1630162 RepID=A0A5M9ZVE5_9BIFI|nr:hypothetical protein [Bifidobacterium tissieri]KAA8831449.1 hypothetical protein EMO89_01560 [Bifidobacterium tissieri]
MDLDLDDPELREEINRLRQPSGHRIPPLVCKDCHRHVERLYCHLRCYECYKRSRRKTPEPRYKAHDGQCVDCGRTRRLGSDNRCHTCRTRHRYRTDPTVRARILERQRAASKQVTQDPERCARRRAYQRAWRQANPDKVKAMLARYRQRKREREMSE